MPVLWKVVCLHQNSGEPIDGSTATAASNHAQREIASRPATASVWSGWRGITM